MARYIADRRPDVRPEEWDDVWVLCVPEESNTDEWAEHLEVSAALTRSVEDLDTLARDVELVEEPPDGCRVFCVPHWRKPREVLLQAQQVAWGLNARLESDGLDGLRDLV
jgi:hypothetical protein